DVVLGRYASFPVPGQVAKLSGADGSTIWTTYVGESTEQLVLVPGGDVLVGIGLFSGPYVCCGAPAAVVRLAGATGAEVWRRVMPPGGTRIGRIPGVALDATGHVIAGGQVAGTQKYDDSNALVAKLSLAGDELWERETDGLGGS